MDVNIRSSPYSPEMPVSKLGLGGLTALVTREAPSWREGCRIGCLLKPGGVRR